MKRALAVTYAVSAVATDDCDLSKEVLSAIEQMTRHEYTPGDDFTLEFPGGYVHVLIERFRQYIEE